MSVFAVVVGVIEDPLVRALTSSLRQRGFSTRHIEPSRLVLEPIEVNEVEVRISDRTLDAVVFVAEPTTSFSSEFTHDDRDFCDAEVRAVWLAI